MCMVVLILAMLFILEIKIDHDDDLNLGLQIGARWFWNDKWGVYLELAGGNTSGFSPGIGVTMKL